VTDLSPGRAARWTGLGAVLGNVLGVAFLWGVPEPYRPGNLGAWWDGLVARPVEAQLSAASFVVGLVLLAVFAVLLAASVPAARRGWLLAGAALVAAGAAVNAAGSAAPIAAVRFVEAPRSPEGIAVARALLGFALATDAAFNLLLGLGLVAVNLALGRDSGWPPWARALGVVAGLASLPVAAQLISDGFARLLAVSGPLWLAWIAAAAAAGLWQRRREAQRDEPRPR
jgi:hypothetical protein